jgi:nitroreductase
MFTAADTAHAGASPALRCGWVPRPIMLFEPHCLWASFLSEGSASGYLCVAPTRLQIPWCPVESTLDPPW